MRSPVVQSRFAPGSGGGVDARRALDELYSNISAAAGSVPVGTVIARICAEGSDDAPGWLPLDGREVSQYDYKQLYSLLGNSAGVASSSTNFVLPDWRGKVLVGYASDPASSNRTGSGDTLLYGAGAEQLNTAYVAWYIKA